MLARACTRSFDITVCILSLRELRNIQFLKLFKRILRGINRIIDLGVNQFSVSFIVLKSGVELSVAWPLTVETLGLAILRPLLINELIQRHFIDSLFIEILLLSDLIILGSLFVDTGGILLAS